MDQEDVKVTFYLKKNEPDAAGRCPVMGLLTVGQTECAFSAKLTVPVSIWESGRAIGKSADALAVNRKLDNYRASVLTIYREQSTIRERVTAEEIKCLLLGMASGQETLLDFFRTFNDNFEKRVGINRSAKTAKTYRTTYKHVTRFLTKQYKLSDIPFSALDRSFIDKFDLYLRTDRHLAANTVKLYMTQLHTVINKAIAVGHITSDPFAGYEPPPAKRKQRYLTGEELKRLMTTPLPSERLYLVRDLFLFSSYTGISYGDLCRLTAADLETAEDGTVWIKTAREKSKVDFEVPLLDLPIYIIDKYRDTTSDGKLLPMYSNSALNEALKRLAAVCGIERRLTFHMARHTYATEITLSNGVPMETVSRMLGHSRVDTTQVYAKVTDDKIEADTQMLDERIANRFMVAI